MATALCFFSQNPFTPPQISLPKISLSSPRLTRSIFTPPLLTSSNAARRLCCKALSTVSLNPSNYEFSDASSEMELRLQLGGSGDVSSRDIFVDAEDSSLKIGVKQFGSFITLLEINQLYEKIKSSETIWYIDDDQLVVNLKKQDPDLKWPDIVESWESLTAGTMQLLKGASIYIVGDATEINDKVAKELAVGLGYTPLSTKELLETFTKPSIDLYTENYNCQHILKDHTAEVQAVTVHATNNYFVSASLDNTWCFYDLSSGLCLTQVADASESEGYTSAAFHPDGLILGTGTSEALVKIWDVKSQANVARFDGHVGAVTAISFSENGYFLATAAHDGVKLWDLRKLRNFRTFTPYDSNTATNSVEFDHSGSYLAVAGSDIRVYQVANVKSEWNCIKTFPDLSGTGKATCVKFGPDAKYLAVGSMDRNLRIFGLPGDDDGPVES